VSWRGHLALDYRRDGERTIAHDLHSGPLRVLQRLYPEGPGICHHVLVHPPGGIVGGDVLELQATLGPGTHAVVTTPGATRFYRSAGAPAWQQATLTVADGARIEWLPLETIAYRGCIAENRLQLALAPGAEAMGWDVLALGLPASDQAFVHGRYQQHLELPGVWLERGLIDAADTALLDGPLGLAGRRVVATLWFAAGSALVPARREALVEAAREVLAGDTLAATAGVSSTHPPVVVLRVLGARVEPVMGLLVRVRAAWRQLAWQLAGNPPRIWRT
jgi:urease accessory protein